MRWWNEDGVRSGSCGVTEYNLTHVQRSTKSLPSNRPALTLVQPETTQLAPLAPLHTSGAKINALHLPYQHDIHHAFRTP